MPITYKHLCSKCKKQYVTITWKTKFPVCWDCQKDDLKGEIKDPKMKKLLGISEALYKKSAFLRSIKINYLRYGNLTEKQIETFKKVTEKVKERD